MYILAHSADTELKSEDCAQEASACVCYGMCACDTGLHLSHLSHHHTRLELQHYRHVAQLGSMSALSSFFSESGMNARSHWYLSHSFLLVSVPYTSEHGMQ